MKFMSFTESVESINAERASVQQLFGGDGVGARHAARRSDPRYHDLLLEAAKLVDAVYSGRKPTYLLKEALGTGDFPNLFGDIIDRQLLGIYNEYQPTYQMFTRPATVSDFRTVKRFAVDGSEAVLTQVGQGEEYPESKLTDTAYSYSVAKYGRKTAINWEAMVDDDLDGLKDLPRRFARAARRSEQKFVTQLYCDANGPHASFYTSGNKNQVKAANVVGGPFTANNPPLSIAGLQEAFAVLRSQQDADGEPIFIDAITLVVPPALEVTAQNILKAQQIWITGDSAGGTSSSQIHVNNWVPTLALAIDPYIPIVAASANGGTAWFLFASTDQSVRPALEFGKLRGHEAPELFMKDSNAIRVGGGAADPMSGDFELDAIVYKIRHVFGGTRLDPKVTVASNGSNS